MKLMNQKLVVMAKALAFLALVVGVSATGFEIKETKATSVLPTGSCVFNIVRNFSGYNAYVADPGNYWGNGVDSAANGLINFNDGSVTMNLTQIINYGSSSLAFDREVESLKGTVTTTATQIPNIYLVTLAFVDPFNARTYSYPLYFASSNSGNTHLIQTKPSTGSKTGAWMGVCQAL